MKKKILGFVISFGFIGLMAATAITFKTSKAHADQDVWSGLKFIGGFISDSYSD